jgi:hypothetical protein
MAESIAFYTDILDFKMKYDDYPPGFPVMDIAKEDGELQLSAMCGQKAFGCSVNVQVDDLDRLFNKFVERGLDTPNKENSPVRQGPLDQTWGIREFYVDEQDGNTLSFGRAIE